MIFPLWIAVLSDLHICAPLDVAEHVADTVLRCNAIVPDLVALPGDPVGHLRPMQPIAAQDCAAVLATLRAPTGRARRPGQP
ncbi:MAG: hypothetical protein FWD68_20060 [Alphaproteobacteria bacterium]|nr:hypothetical protein [Alphaproteobacteria bacterium]